MKTFTGIEYLAIDLANHFGLDKELFETRIQWVKDNWSNLEAFADQADEPHLYKKAVINIRRVAKGEVSGHLVALDATCSGIQVMSALTGCPKGAEATGLINPNKRADAYSAVTDAMNQILADQGKDQISIKRADAKRAVMTACYGSKKVPKEVFGEGEMLDTFYAASAVVAEGAFTLLDDLLSTWQPYALAHTWRMPDGDYINIKVMQKVETRLEIDELGHHQMTAQYRVHQGKKRGVSNVANVVHSLDAYLLRTMIRRCNYNPNQTNKAIELITAELAARYPNYKLEEMSDKIAFHYDLYVKTNMVDTVIVPHLTQQACESLPTEYLKELLALLERIVEHKPFTVETVHDAFMCLADNCDRMRYWYKEIMAEFAESTILDFIISTILNVEATYPKYTQDLGDKIRQSNYAIC